MKHWNSTKWPTPPSFKPPALITAPGLQPISMTRTFAMCKNWHGFSRPAQSWEQWESNLESVDNRRQEPFGNCTMVMDVLFSCPKERGGEYRPFSPSWAADYNFLLEVGVSVNTFLHTTSSFSIETMEQVQQFIQGTFLNKQSACTATEETVCIEVLNKGNDHVDRNLWRTRCKINMQVQFDLFMEILKRRTVCRQRGSVQHSTFGWDAWRNRWFNITLFSIWCTHEGVEGVTFWLESSVGCSAVTMASSRRRPPQVGIF